MGGYVKVVLITGGTSGLGKAMCQRLAAQGHQVYGSGRSARDGEAPGGYRLLQMDVRDARSVHRAVEEVIRREGRIDAVVNNAGIGIQGPLEDIPDELARQVLDTNLLGPHRVCQAVLPHMRARKSGLIINISSVGANFGLPYRGFYSASKAALDRYGEALYNEAGRFGIRVVTVQPGEFNTAIAGNRLKPAVIDDANKPGYDRAMAVLGGSLHYSRDPDELARVVARILRQPDPKPRYVVATGLQRLSTLASTLLPQRLFLRMLRRHYE